MMQCSIGLCSRTLLGLSFIFPFVFSASTVNVALQAAFPAPPYLLELLETAAEENVTSYFPLLDSIASGYFDGTDTDQDLYKKFLTLIQNDGHITDDQSISAFKLSLSVHSAAPRIEAHYQYYNTTVRQAIVDGKHTDCESWLLFNDQQHCIPDLGQEGNAVSHAESIQRTLSFDRILGNINNETPAILYADVLSNSFRKFHNLASQTAKNGRTSYRVRYKPSSQHVSKPLTISGYGVGMALKRTDYIVIDDREKEEITSKQDGDDVQAVLADKKSADLKPLTSSELRNLGMQAASFIMASEDKEKFETMLRISQDFPKYSNAIAATEISEDLKQEARTMSMHALPPGLNAVWINGLQVTPRDLEVFSLLERLRRERRLINGVKSLGLTGDEAIKLISHAALSEESNNQDVQRYDWRDTTEGGNVIIWMNDIEKDKRYMDWPEQVQGLLQRMYPGQLPVLRKELHNLICPVDFSDKTDVTSIIENLQNFVQRKVPIRIGLVPITQSVEAEQQTQVILSLCDTYGLASALAYLELLLPNLDKNALGPSQKYWDAAVKDRQVRKGHASISYKEALQSTKIKAHLEASKIYLSRLGGTEFLMNGVPIPRGENWISQMGNRVSTDMRTIQQAVYMQEIDDDTFLPGRFLHNALPGRNPLIIPSDEKELCFINLAEHSTLLTNPMLSVDADDATNGEIVQMIVIADFDSSSGYELFKTAVEIRRKQIDIQLVFVPTTPSMKDGFVDRFSKALKGEENHGLDLLDNLDLQPESGHRVEVSTDEDILLFETATKRLIEEIDVPTEASAIIVNGRVAGPIPPSITLDFSALEMLIVYERKKRIEPVREALKALDMSEKTHSAKSLVQLTNLVALSKISDVPDGIFDGGSSNRIDIFDQIKAKHTLIELGDKDSASIHIIAAVDPASEKAQRALPIIKVLSQQAGVYIAIILTPVERLEELPIKRFYRHVLNAEPTFDDAGSLKDPSAFFDSLPADALLTIGMDLPPAWLVSPKDSVHDLDNLRLSSVSTENVEAIYQLDNILIEGHSKDAGESSPPRGAQLVLSTGQDDKFADTIIMANLGYFQFKANPGIYNLSLKKGRSQEVFHIDNAGQSLMNNAGNQVALTSFKGTTLLPLISRNPGMENEDVLEPDSGTDKHGDSLAEKAGDWLAKASQKVASLAHQESASTKAISTLPHADINIFSVASGHLYERMLNLMMVSVMRHTSHTVKFWFIEQFLSPSFKAFLPHIAEEYNFRYEMVTYKWPHWLRSQKEKQREIWGYKILFLDVLFPLDLDKVIFVDADQIVRTDMYQLVTYDLQGAPYGFTPMCNSRTEMEGFRFWNQGYWKGFLQGLPYHISALYVVDLVRFRALAAGDRLRQQYHQLSADPNSLSNLDQDLPNHMQHVLPIHSLPQEWLWCETWCDDDSLKVAKTIDLCNNPLTKEPKLERARRQIPEWNVYDEEVAALVKRKRAEGEEVGGKDEVDEQEKLQEEEYRKKLEEEKQKVIIGDFEGKEPKKDDDGRLVKDEL